MNRRAFLQLPLASLAMVDLLAQDAVAGLQLLLGSEPTHDGRPRVAATFRNTTSSRLTLNIGVVLGNGAYANGIQFLLKDSQGRVRRLVKRDPGIIAGSAGPYVVELSAGASFVLPSIDLIDYWSYEPKIAVLHLPTGVHTLVATFQGGDPSDGFVPAPGQPPMHRWPQRFWVGRVSSEPIAVRVSSRF